MHHIGQGVCFPSWSHSHLGTSNGAADMTVSFFTSPDVNRTVLFVGNGTGTRQEGMITSKRGSRLRHSEDGLGSKAKVTSEVAEDPPLQF